MRKRTVSIILASACLGVASSVGPLRAAAQQTFAGAQQTLAGAQQAPVGARQAPVGDRQALVGARQVVVGARQVVVGARQALVGVQQAFVGVQQALVGVQQALADATATPEATAELFLRSIRLIRWNTAAQFIHPETLERFHQTVTMIADADSTGAVREYFTGTDSAASAALDHAAVFDRAIGTMIDDMPGLMHAIYDRDDEVIGHVVEGAREAHVVYRTTARISGAVSEVKVMQLERVPDGWRVFWSDELEVLETALRGVARNRRPPGRH